MKEKTQLMSKLTMIILLISCLQNEAFAQLACQDKYKPKPNVLFIIVDDLGYTDVGYMGSNYYETPNIDQLASKGIFFTQNYSNACGCSPSRASIMMGQFTARHGITTWIGEVSGEDWRKRGQHSKLLPPTYRHHLPHQADLLPEVMKESGYKTFFAGKWHLGGEGSYPKDHGFDINIGGWERGSPKGGYFSPYDNPKLSDGPKGENLTLRLARETANFIHEYKDTAFFAYLSFYAGHSGLQTTQERWKKYQLKAVEAGIEVPGFELVQGYVPHRLYQDNPVYAGVIRTMDEAVGIVLQALREEQLDDNTIIIFTSDNGGVTTGEQFSTNLSPLRGGKGTLWEGGIRVPLIIFDPRLRTEIKSIKTPVIGSDLFPTILDLADIKLAPESHIDGRSLAPLLVGGDIEKRSLIWHQTHHGHHGGEPASAIRKGNWKLIHYYKDGGTNKLFNIPEDISEKNDLANNYPNVVKSLYAELDSFLLSVQAKYPIPDPKYDAQKRAEWEDKQRSRLPKLEKQRIEMLSNEYQPNEDWWGSG